MALPRTVIPVVATVFLNLLGFGMLLPILPRIAADYLPAGGYTLGDWSIGPGAVAGALMGVYSLMQLLFNPFWGGLSDRRGRKPVLVLTTIGWGLSFLLFAAAGFAPTAWVIPVMFLSRTLAGLFGATIGTAQAFVADLTTDEDRTRGMGLLGASFGMGFLLGPAIGGLLSHLGGIPLVGIGGAILSFATATMAQRRLPATTPKAIHRVTLPQAIAGIGLLAIAFLLSTTGFAEMEATLVLFTKDTLGYGDLQNGLLFATIGVLAAIVQGGITHRVAKRTGEARLVTTGMLLNAVGLVLLPLATSAPALLGALSFFAVGSGLAGPSLTTVISRIASEHVRGTALGATQGLGSLGRLVGPLLGGGLYDQGIAWPFWSGAAIVATGAAIAAVTLRNR